MATPRRKPVSEEVMIRVSEAINRLEADQNAPRTKRQLEVISGLGHDAVARAFRQDASQSAGSHQLTARWAELTDRPGGYRSPAAHAEHQARQHIAELQQTVRELNTQLDRYAMALFAGHLEQVAHDDQGEVIEIRRRRSLHART
jgi:hypothetical protein